MSDDIKKEKMELRKQFFEQIEQVKGVAETNEIMKLVKVLNEELNIHDSKIENFVDTVTQWFTKSEIAKIKNYIDDILDNYDKIKKDGNPYYNSIEKEKITNCLIKVTEICQRNFWDRFKNVLKGS